MNESKKQRDIATNAFRRYAALGCPTCEAYESMLRGYVVQKYGDGSDDMLSRRMLSVLEENKQIILDIEAVDHVITKLEQSKRSDIIGAIRAVYFEQPRRVTYKGEIEARVVHYAMTCPADRRTVYAWLRRAREMFFRERGIS